MGDTTKIGWTDHTLNPWIGCTEVSAACDHCYARDQNAFRKWNKAGWGKGTPRHRTSSATWAKARKWNAEAAALGRRDRVFCASLADVFDSEVDPAWRVELFELIRSTPHLDWQLLTKRPHLIERMLPKDWGDGWPNVWLGTTVEDQRAARGRLYPLLEVPARVHFVSYEPALGPVDLSRVVLYEGDGLNTPSAILNAFTGVVAGPDEQLARVDWVIAGGESGENARPMDLAWALSMREQCRAGGAAYFFKQVGSVATGSARDHGYDPKYWPEQLRVQEFPKVRHA